MRWLRLSVVCVLLGAQTASLAEALDTSQSKCRCTHGPGAPCSCMHHLEAADQTDTSSPCGGLQQTCCGAARHHGPAVLTWVLLPERTEHRVERGVLLTFAAVPRLTSVLRARPPRPPPRSETATST